MTKREAMELAALALAAALAGCTDWLMPTPTPDRGNVGRYELVVIASRRLPQPSAIPGVTYWGGSLTLRADSTYSDVITVGDATRATGADTVRGTWRVVGDSVRLTPQGWRAYAGRRYSDEIAVRWAEGVYAYQRTP